MGGGDDDEKKEKMTENNDNEKEKNSALWYFLEKWDIKNLEGSHTLRKISIKDGDDYA